MSRVLLFVVLLLNACSASTVRVVASHTMDPSEVDMLLLEAGDILGMEIVQTTEGKGAVSLSIHDARGGHAGEAQVSVGCRRAAWSEPDPKVIAHELGHTLGLEHSDDPDNLMFHIAQSDLVTDEQQRTIEQEAWVLEACRPSPK